MIVVMKMLMYSKEWMLLMNLMTMMKMMMKESWLNTATGHMECLNKKIWMVRESSMEEIKMENSIIMPTL